MINNETLEKQIQGRKIDLRTVVSTTEKRCTLMQWLQAVEKALNAGTLKTVEVSQPAPEQATFKFIFDDGTFVETLPIVLPKGPKGDKGDPGGEGGSIDAADLLKLLEGSDTVVVDLTQDGQRVEIHVDETFKQTLATKTMLAAKINTDTVYSNDEPAFADAMEQVVSKDDFYAYFYNLRKEPTKTYLIQGEEGVAFDNVKNALSMPNANGQKWSLLCECMSSEAGGFFIKLSLTNSNHSILYTNIIGGWLTGSKLGVWQDASNAGGGLQPVTEKNVVYATDAQGHQTTVQYNKTASGGGLAQRNNDGTLEVATPTRDNDAATKEYVDAHSGGGGAMTWKKISYEEFKVLRNEPNHYFKCEINVSINGIVKYVNCIGPSYKGNYGTILSCNGIYIDGSELKNLILCTLNNYDTLNIYSKRIENVEWANKKLIQNDYISIMQLY